MKGKITLEKYQKDLDDHGMYSVILYAGNGCAILFYQSEFEDDPIIIIIVLDKNNDVLIEYEKGYKDDYEIKEYLEWDDLEIKRKIL